MDIVLKCLENEITQVKGFPPGVLDLPNDPPVVQILNRMLIIDERSKTVRKKNSTKITPVKK